MQNNHRYGAVVFVDLLSFSAVHEYITQVGTTVNITASFSRGNKANYYVSNEASFVSNQDIGISTCQIGREQRSDSCSW